MSPAGSSLSFFSCAVFSCVFRELFSVLFSVLFLSSFFCSARLSDSFAFGFLCVLTINDANGTVEHGITTVLMGNCSVSLAPCKPDHREHSLPCISRFFKDFQGFSKNIQRLWMDFLSFWNTGEFLAGLMEVVEEIPKATLVEHLPWNWESYGEYLNAVEQCQPTINVCGLASLASLRLAVVGEERLFDDTETYTDDEVAQIAALAAESVRGGAFGVSCIRNRAHRDRQGRPPPGNCK